MTRKSGNLLAILCALFVSNFVWGSNFNKHTLGKSDTCYLSGDSFHLSPWDSIGGQIS